ncbi:MAG: LuxR C-terminal-related transcriptional regulator [Desulfovibrio sp.]|nr:LuxR C-terminal-related transcriptional regulator [Desulfovibrio sp.]
MLRLTPRGKEVFLLALEGLNINQIAERMGISYSGVLRHRSILTSILYKKSLDLSHENSIYRNSGSCRKGIHFRHCYKKTTC